MKKKTVSILMAIAMTMAMTACGSNGSTGAEEASAEAKASAEKSYTIGISQFAEHGSLDNCREGFLEGLRQSGFVEGENLTVLYDNAQADGGMASQINDNYIAQKVNLICAIATPMAQSAYSVARKQDIPVIYTAVTDPVLAELAGEDRVPVG